MQWIAFAGFFLSYVLSLKLYPVFFESGGDEKQTFAATGYPAHSAFSQVWIMKKIDQVQICLSCFQVFPSKEKLGGDQLD